MIALFSTAKASEIVNKQDFIWATLLRRDGGLRTPTQRAPDTSHRRPPEKGLPAPQNSSSHPTGMDRLFVYARRAWHGAAQRGKAGEGGDAGSETRGGVH